MKPAIKRVIVFILFIGITLGAYFLATGITDSIYAYRSPLKENSPPSADPLGEPMARKVVFVLIDALRYDTSLNADIMPTLNNLRSQAAYARTSSQTPSYSAPGYSVLFTGAWPYLSDGPAFNLDYDDIPAWTQDNLFTAAKRNGLNTAASAYYWFEKLIPADSLDVGFFTAGEDQAADREVVDAALPWIRSNDYQLILIHIDQVDYAGHHEGGPAGPNWDTAANRADSLLAEILSALDLEQDVIFVASDHGQIDAGGHGGQDPVTLVEPFVLAGKGITPGDYGDILMVDIAPTLAAVLGTNIPAAAQGQVLVEMLSGLPETVSAALPQAILAQQQGLLKTYETAMGITTPTQITDQDQIVLLTQQQIEKYSSQRLSRERIWRLIPTLIVLAGVFWLLKKNSQKGDINLLLGAVTYTVLFHLIYFVVRGKVYSYSAIISQSELIVVNGLIVLILMTAIWYGFARWMKWFEQGKTLLLDRSSRLFFVTIFLTSLPVLVHFVWNGLYVGWTLPVLGIHYIALLSLLQIMFLAGGALLIYLGLMVFFDRKNERLTA
ncbi:MAG: hypothetical protein CL609_17675 [Anaerolineaceae bacterium]|nr:hypothetical protein [Anaerolineaceae bacterium]